MRIFPILILAALFSTVSCSKYEGYNGRKETTRSGATGGTANAPAGGKASSDAKQGPTDATPDIKKPLAEEDPALARVEKCKRFAWEKIAAPEDIDCFKSVEAVYASLPEWVRPFFILIKKTESAQSASLTKPRVVMVSPDGTFILAAATDQSGRNDLEVAVYDYKKSEWQFAGIDYTKNPPVLEKELCTTCHGQVLHPIWTGYNQWPAAYAGNPYLTGEEANILKAAASKTGSYPPLLNYAKLKPAKDYKEGALLYPASPYGDNENNQILNFVSAAKLGRSLAAKVTRDPLVDKAALGAIVRDTVCRGTSGTLERLGYPPKKYLSHNIEPKGDSYGVNWVGFAPITFYFGIQLLDKMMKDDPALKARLPTVAAVFNQPEFGILTTSSPDEYLRITRQTQHSWYHFDFEIIHPLAANVFGDKSEACATIEKL